MNAVSVVQPLLVRQAVRVRRVAESLLTQMAAAIVHGLALAHQLRHRLLDVLGQLQLSGAAIDRSVLRTLVHAACQVKVCACVDVV